MTGEHFELLLVGLLGVRSAWWLPRLLAARAMLPSTVNEPLRLSKDLLWCLNKWLPLADLLANRTVCKRWCEELSKDAAWNELLPGLQHFYGLRRTFAQWTLSELQWYYLVYCVPAACIDTYLLKRGSFLPCRARLPLFDAHAAVSRYDSCFIVDGLFVSVLLFSLLCCSQLSCCYPAPLVSQSIRAL